MHPQGALRRQVLPSYEDVDPEFSGDVSALRQSSEAHGGHLRSSLGPMGGGGSLGIVNT